jgi:2,4-dienoyl-CoA reductase-like NADH-dependent reductase (Old Yellow Enzyme family)
MQRLFEETTLKGMGLRNRFVRSATWEGLAADDGAVSPELIDVSRRLAEGGVGLIISGHTYVRKEGQAGLRQMGIYADALTAGVAEMAAAIHREGAKCCLQLAHAGARGATQLSGMPAKGPSAGAAGQAESREMTLGDIEETIRGFADAAVRAKAAGCDAVQLHGAHGYLISQFLSPFFNKRTDGYGGTIGNRSRFAVEVLQAVRRAVGADFPVFIKLNAADFLDGGLTVDDMLAAAAALEAAGIDAIELSGGTFLSGRYLPSRIGKPEAGETEAYYEAAARRYKAAIHVPLMLVGGIHTLETAERLVGENIADYIALCRPLIREPGLVNRWKSGDREAARCVSDNGCFKPGFEGRGVYCVVEERERSREQK